MEQLICHMCGDYVLQNHWMATRKTQAWIPAIVHAATYMLPFLLLQPSWLALGVMFGTHAVIDRFRLAAYWTRFWGVGNPGWLWAAMESDTAPWEMNWGKTKAIMADESRMAPPWLGVWLLIIVDNTMHLAINYASLKWL